MKALKFAGWSMIGAGSLILLFLVYQLGFTNLLTARAQTAASTALEERFEDLRSDPPDEVVVVPTIPESTSTTTTVDDGTTTITNAVAVAAEPISYFPESSPETGSELGRIIIPKLELEKVIVEGVDRSSLKIGPGHMPWTPLPGQPGNSVISGHRTTYGAPFSRLDEVEKGDEILIETVLGTHTYIVREIHVVLPTDVWVTNRRPGAWLTLTTCTPRFSARQRLVIVAELVDGPNLEYARAIKAGIIEEAST